MQTSYQTLKVFICSPSDVSTERDLAEETIRRVSDNCGNILGVGLEVARWEKFAPNTPHLPEQRIQDIIDEEVQKCHIFLLILFKRYGSVERGHKKSNTEREVDIALRMLLKEKRITFLSYFRDLPKNEDPGNQERRIRELRTDLTKKGIWYSNYARPSDFKEKLTHDLYQTILKFRLSTAKQKALQSFWQIGTTDRPTFPRLAIVYPPIDRPFMGAETDTRFWFRRLLPNIVFEDFKALQKIEKVLRLIGFWDFRIYGTSSIPADIRFMNRVWIGLPRSTRSLQQVDIYAERARFRFLPRKRDSISQLLWRSSNKGEGTITVKSPLSIYLTEQRQGFSGVGEWDPQMGHIVAKDYAVLARFSDIRPGSPVMTDGYLKDYFVAGIRGLGTWGAAWFIDHQYNLFAQVHESEDIQMLLEVTYRNERIFEVKDVSHERQGYFSAQNSLREIRRIIRIAREGVSA